MSGLAAHTRHKLSEQPTSRDTEWFDDGAQIVATVNSKPVTRTELCAVYNLVADPINWKFPIDRVIEVDFDTIDRVREAVTFFAGCRAQIEVVEPAATRGDGRSKYRVTAPGYYAAVGA